MFLAKKSHINFEKKGHILEGGWWERPDPGKRGGLITPRERPWRSRLETSDTILIGEGACQAEQGCPGFASPRRGCQELRETGGMSPWPRLSAGGREESWEKETPNPTDTQINTLPVHGQPAGTRPRQPDRQGDSQPDITNVISMQKNMAVMKQKWCAAHSIKHCVSKRSYVISLMFYFEPFAHDDTTVSREKTTTMH